MKGEYDAIVVGAGPSGSFCAKTMAENGLDVLIVEKKQEIGTPLRCAEGVGKGAFIELLGEIDEKWIAMEIEGAEIYAPDGTKITMVEEHSGNEVGYVLERKIFDRFLAEEAVRAGAELMVKTRATGLLMDGRRVRGVRLSRRGESFEVESSLVIGADGVESLVGRWAGINTALKPNDIESCAQYLVKGIDVKPYCEFYLGKSIAPGGYAWVF
ncbi:MAG: NAD(P)/FAD-dependent oxidoreductase, partial [Archaeoglobi archaeon]|nr:NAD(P)/FAD-dependent oxidoreductase [Candidatus Mnemosynella sp.]